MSIRSRITNIEKLTKGLLSTTKAISRTKKMLNITGDDSVKELAEQLHSWYLEAIKELAPESYNAYANKSFDELTEEQRSIDFYIAEKIINQST